MSFGIKNKKSTEGKKIVKAVTLETLVALIIIGAAFEGVGFFPWCNVN